MKITTLPKCAFDDYMERDNITNDNVEGLDVVYISIINSEDVVDEFGMENIHYFSDGLENVLNLVFDDVERDINQDGQRAIAFTQEQAKIVVDFLEKNKNKSRCIIHCGAGVSRSGAIATFLNDYLHQDYFQFKLENPYIHPNNQVIALLNHELRTRNL